MGTGYVRNDAANNIADGNVINASDLDGEFDALQAAFNATTGHSHDGTTGEGPTIGTAGIANSAVTNAKIANDAVTLGTQTTGNYVAAGATSGSGISGSVSSEGGTFTVTSNATNANTGSTIVFRDASGNFSAGTVTAALSGNASTATTLQTARTIGGVSFNGAANINLPGVNTTGNQNTSGSAATLTTARTIGGVSFNGSANINLPGVNTAGNQNTSGTAAVSTAATVTTSATASAFKVPFANTTASTTGNYGLLQDSTATFTYNPSTNTLVVGTVSAALSGNATTATTLQTARTIGGVSFNGSANINLPGVNTAGNQNTTGSAATLTTARTIGGVSFNGSANINLPGVNTAGNQNTTGSAATLTTARTIELGGDVTGSASFNGSANITITSNIAANVVGANEINVSGDGTSGQVLTSDGDGSMSWTTPAAGANDGIFWENDQAVTANYTITSGKNAGTFGPIAINSGVTVTVPSGSTWTVV